MRVVLESTVTPGDKNKIENICVTAIFCPTGNFSKFPKLCLVFVWSLIGTKAGIIRESREYVGIALYYIVPYIWTECSLSQK